MTANNDDLALETLLAVRQEQAPNLDEQLVRNCYALQKNHQFDKDRTVTVQAMERLIEEHLKSLSPDGQQGGVS